MSGHLLLPAGGHGGQESKWQMFHYNSKPTWLTRNRRTQVADGEQEGSLGQVDRGRAMRMTAKL